jgi:beta-phosphoglucomutase-like phosphatase (HAD superfamily)
MGEKPFVAIKRLSGGMSVNCSMDILGVLFDLGGTLINPREGIVACLKYALTAMGYSCPSDSELERFIGPPEGRWKTNIKTNLVTQPNGPREK